MSVRSATDIPTNSESATGRCKDRDADSSPGGTTRNAISVVGWGGWWALLGDTDVVSKLPEIGNGFTRDSKCIW